MVGRDLEHVLVGGPRLRELAGLDVGLGQGDPRLREPRVLARRLPEDSRGLVEAPGEAQVVAEHHLVLGGEGRLPREAAQLGDRPAVLAGGAVGHGQRPAGDEETRVLGEHGRQLPDRQLRVGPHGHHAGVETAQERHTVLRVAQVRAGRRRRAAADVAERTQPLRRLGVERRRRVGHRPGERRLQRVAHRREPCVLGRGPVRRLAGVGGEVVELRLRRLDVLVARRPPREERGPPELALRVERLGVGRRVAHLAALDRRPQRAALDLGTAREARVVEERREHVDAPRHRRRHAGADRGPGHEEGHEDRRVVHEEAVRLLAVLAEALAVVGGDEHERAGEGARLLEPPQQPRELLVDERDLAVVRRIGEARGEARGRLVRRVRVVVVDPQEERAAVRGRVHPPQDGVRRRVGEALDVQRAARVVALRQVVVVHVEGAVEAEAAVQREARHERRRAVARLAEVLGGGPHVRRQRVTSVVPDAVGEGHRPGEDRRVRGSRERHVRDRGREAGAPCGEAVEGRRQCGRAPVAADVVGPQRVDRDQQHVRPAAGRRGGRTGGRRPPAGGQRQHGESQSQAGVQDQGRSRHGIRCAG